MLSSYSKVLIVSANASWIEVAVSHDHVQDTEKDMENCLLGHDLFIFNNMKGVVKMVLCHT